MITGIYFFLLLVASVEDYKSHTVQGYKIVLLWLLGCFNIIFQKNNRWVTITLTCICFLVLFLVYLMVGKMAEKKNCFFVFGGADVRMIPAMMLVQGWDVALTGVFLGLLGAILIYLSDKKHNREIPLVPWMSSGCFLVEIFYLFS